jgi:hypothetical protein
MRVTGNVCIILSEIYLDFITIISDKVAGLNKNKKKPRNKGYILYDERSSEKVQTSKMKRQNH